MTIHYSQEADRRRAAAAAVHVLERPREECRANKKLQNRWEVLQNHPRQDG